MIRINETTDYYKTDSGTLYWEMTICQSLKDILGASSKALAYPRPYGELLADFLRARLDTFANLDIVEVGGGHGTLMAALAGSLKPVALTMIDLNPGFLELQKECLRGSQGVRYVLSDILDWLKGTKESHDLLIANEFLGDLPTALVPDIGALRARAALGPPFGASYTERTARLLCEYRLRLPAEGEAIINLGALELVEGLKGKFRHAFLSEHSANAKSGEPYDFLVPLADGVPRRIRLKGHDEYSIDFDNLEIVAEAAGFSVERIWMPRFLGIRHDAGARFMSGAECVGSPVAEEIHEFLHHAKEYECLFLTAR